MKKNFSYLLLSLFIPFAQSQNITMPAISLPHDCALSYDFNPSGRFSPCAFTIEPTSKVDNSYNFFIQAWVINPETHYYEKKGSAFLHTLSKKAILCDRLSYLPNNQTCYRFQLYHYDHTTKQYNYVNTRDYITITRVNQKDAGSYEPFNLYKKRTRRDTIKSFAAFAGIAVIASVFYTLQPNLVRDKNSYIATIQQPKNDAAEMANQDRLEGDLAEATHELQKKLSELEDECARLRGYVHHHEEQNKSELFSLENKLRDAEIALRKKDQDFCLRKQEIRNDNAENTSDKILSERDFLQQELQKVQEEMVIIKQALACYKQINENLGTAITTLDTEKQSREREYEQNMQYWQQEFTSGLKNAQLERDLLQQELQKVQEKMVIVEQALADYKQTNENLGTAITILNTEKKSRVGEYKQNMKHWQEELKMRGNQVDDLQNSIKAVQEYCLAELNFQVSAFDSFLDDYNAESKRIEKTYGSALPSYLSPTTSVV